MAKQTINVGSAPDDGTGESVRSAFAKANAMYDELYAAVQELAIPTDIILTIIEGGVNIAWTSGNIEDDTEIWGKSDSGTYALLYTITAGTETKDDLLEPVDLRYYKLRARKGAKTSYFTAEQYIALLGPELITVQADREFSSDTGFWYKSPTTVTIADGVAHFIAANQFDRLRVDPFLTVGKNYRFKHTMLNRTSGTFTPFLGATALTSRSANGSYTDKAVCTTNQALNLYQYAASPGTFDIDNISLKEILGP